MAHIILTTYLVSLAISWATILYFNWEDLHTVKDFLLPGETPGENAVIWVPLANTLFAAFLIADTVQTTVRHLLNIRIK
jgi:hypothetical protein